MTDEARLRLSQARPDNPEAVFRAALGMLKAGLPEDVLPMVEAAIARHPNDARLWQVAGLAHRDLEDSEKAMGAFGRAAQLARNDALIAHSLARVTLEAGLPATALFERALALAPNDGSVRLGLAAALFAEGRLDDAVSRLDATLVDHPGWLAGHATLARLRWMSGDRENFAASLERALRTAPRRLDLWLALIGRLMEAERYEQALAAIARARAALGAGRHFDMLEAACAAEQGETQRADRLFAAAGPISHVNDAVRYVRHLLRANRPAEAAAFVEPRLSADPSHVLVPYLATAWRLTGGPRWAWLEGDPRLIGVYDIADKVGSLDALADCLRRLHIASDQPLDQTLRGGTQTDGPLFARIEPEIRALRRAVLETVAAHVAQLPPRDPRHPQLAQPRAPIRFSGSWSVRLLDAGYHINHVHSAGWFSSAFYVALPESGLGGEPHAGWLTLGELTELGLTLEPIRLIEPKPGRLVLFPSTMWHGTRPFDAGERLTVAFDVARPGSQT